MQGLRRSLFLITLPLVTFGCLTSMDTAKGQIIPDNTLGAEKSVVTPDGIIERIDGGARQGANLFHSFQEFNVGEGKEAYFSNPARIENIISRVTGRNTSNIYGTLGVSGNANLFFINPNGIVFGQNARLDVRGSFLASTANSLVFENGVEFSATNPQTSPPLSVSIPIGLRFRGNPGSIMANNVGLQVNPGKSLSLVGGDINLDQGRLTAAGGQINLGGLAGDGTVGLSSDGNLSFPNSVRRGNVSLTNGAQVNVTAKKGGSVNIYAQNLNLDNSAICTGIGATPTCEKRESDVGKFENKSQVGESIPKAGNVTLNTMENLTMNKGSQVTNIVNNGARGNAGDITIETKNLTLTDGARFNSSTFGQGNAGTIDIHADTVSFDGVGITIYDKDEQGNNLSVFTGALSRVEPKAQGDAGDIKISTKNLTLTNGARLVVGILKDASGNKAGTITINAESVTFKGLGNDNSGEKYPSGAFSYVGGELASQGKYTSITINTKKLELINGAKISAVIDGKGIAGTINIQADDTILFDAVGANITCYYSGAYSYAELADKSTFQLRDSQPGDITITTNKLTLINAARISASKYNLQKDNQTTSNTNNSTPKSEIGEKGGNITLTIRDIFLSRESRILSAGSDKDTNTEGNIDIKVETLVLYEGSRIQTNLNKRSGNITIGKWHGKLVIFVSHDSIISASGELKIEPTLTVQPLEIPQVKLVEPTEQIAQNPCQRGVGTKFIITGRGGLPPSPNEATSSDSVRVDLVEPAPVGSTGAGEQKRRGAEEKTKSSFTKAIVPAQGWIFNKKGEVMLTAYDPTGTGSQRPFNSNACSVP